jgi:hypothetical protein
LDTPDEHNKKIRDNAITAIAQAKRVPESVGRFVQISISKDGRCCSAAADQSTIIFHAEDAPLLPLSVCDKERCLCCYTPAPRFVAEDLVAQGKARWFKTP